MSYMSTEKKSYFVKVMWQANFIKRNVIKYLSEVSDFEQKEMSSCNNLQLLKM